MDDTVPIIVPNSTDNLPSHNELSAQLHLIRRLNKWWKENFTRLTGKPLEEWESFDDFQISALIMMDHSRLRRAVDCACDAWGGDATADAESVIATTFSMPYLARLCLPNFEDGANMHSSQSEAAHRISIDYRIRDQVPELWSTKVYHIIPTLCRGSTGLMRICLRGVNRIIPQELRPSGGYDPKSLSQMARHLFASQLSNSYWNMITLPDHLSDMWLNAHVTLKPLGEAWPTSQQSAILPGYTAIKLQVVPLVTRLDPDDSLPQDAGDFRDAFWPATRVCEKPGWVDWFTNTGPKVETFHSENGFLTNRIVPIAPEEPRFLFFPVLGQDLPMAYLAFQLRYVTTVATAWAGGPKNLPHSSEHLPDYFDDDLKFKGSIPDDSKYIEDLDYL